jgi:hypothetical protein
MDERTCSFPECEAPLECRGLCRGHYAQWRRGTPLKPIRRNLTEAELRAIVVERFWSNVDKAGPPFRSLGNCWLWTSAVMSMGYGVATSGTRKQCLAHRLSYELHHGEVPEGLVVDHICGVPLCVNPSHLRAVTQKQNAEHLTKLNARNRSGYRGVAWNAGTKKWTAQVKSGARKHHLGYFTNPEEAAHAAAAKRQEVFTHDDHDGF